MLNIHELRIFLMAAETENFSEAGRRLNISQPAVSMQIRSTRSHRALTPICDPMLRRVNLRNMERQGRLLLQSESVCLYCLR